MLTKVIKMDLEEKYSSLIKYYSVYFRKFTPDKVKMGLINLKNTHPTEVINYLAKKFGVNLDD